MSYNHLSLLYRILLLIYFGFAYLAKPSIWDFYLPIHIIILLFFILTSDILLKETKEKKIKNIIIKYDKTQIIALMFIILIGTILFFNFNQLKSEMIINYLSWLIYSSSLIRLKIEPINRINDN